MSFWITCSSSPLAPNLTSSKTLKCFTCAKPLKSSAWRVRAVRAATAELDIGIAPAVLSSAGYMKFSRPPASSSNATSISRTRKVLATPAQIASGVRSSISHPACWSISPILLSMTQERLSGKVTNVPLRSRSRPPVAVPQVT